LTNKIATPIEQTVKMAKPSSVRLMAKRVTPLWLCAVVIGSFLPGSSKAYIGTSPNLGYRPVEMQHRLAHIAVFGITALLLLLPADTRLDEARAAGKAFLLGVGIELGQLALGLSPAFEWWDVRDDFIGASLVFFTFQLGRALLALR
jgi:hypothetical protein